MPTLSSVLNQLEQERRRLISQIKSLSNALSALRPQPRRMSAAGRARIAAAQRLRWAKAKGPKVAATANQKRRRMSANAIARIRAAQKARWAKWGAQKKKR